MTHLISGLASLASLIFNASSGGAAKTAASRRSPDAQAPEASAVVTLSPQAEALAGFAGKGILVSQGQLDAPIGAVSRGGGSGSGGRTGGAALLSGQSVSAQDFKDLLTRFGASDAEKAELTAGFDTNQDGAISHDEFLKGLANTSASKTGTDFSHAVLQLMDRGGNGDGVVAAKEFAAFTTAFANTEKRLGSA